MKRVLFALIAVIAIAACNEYEFVVPRAVKSYEKKGVNIITYNAGAGKNEHNIIFSHKGSVYVNTFEKEYPIRRLMSDKTMFSTIHYKAHIDNMSSQVVLDSLVDTPSSVFSILGCSLANAYFYDTGRTYSFVMQGRNGCFFFDLRRPDCLMYLGDNFSFTDKGFKCSLQGDLREYEWSDPITYIPYYFESHPYTVDAEFDLNGKLVSLSNFCFGNTVLKESFLSSTSLDPERIRLDTKYDEQKTKEMDERAERILQIRISHAVPFGDIVQSFSRYGDDDESEYMHKNVVFWYSFDSILFSNREGYEFMLTGEYNSRNKFVVHTNDTTFLSKTFPGSYYIEAHLDSREVTHSFWSTKSNLIFTDGEFLK